MKSRDKFELKMNLNLCDLISKCLIVRNEISISTESNQTKLNVQIVFVLVDVRLIHVMRRSLFHCFQFVACVSDQNSQFKSCINSEFCIKTSNISLFFSFNVSIRQLNRAYRASEGDPMK